MGQQAEAWTPRGALKHVVLRQLWHALVDSLAMLRSPSRQQPLARCARRVPNGCSLGLHRTHSLPSEFSLTCPTASHRPCRSLVRYRQARYVLNHAHKHGYMLQALTGCSFVDFLPLFVVSTSTCSSLPAPNLHLGPITCHPSATTHPPPNPLCPFHHCLA